MSYIRHKKKILDTIADLRARKSRPDLDRICKFMLKTHKVSPRDTRADLRLCVARNILQEVEYKDNVSYRTIDERTERKSGDGKQMSNSGSNERRLITSVVAELIYRDGGSLERGVSFGELAKAVASKSGKLTRKHVETNIQREIAAGTLVRLPGGHVALGPADNEDSSDSINEFNADSNPKMTSSHSSGGSASPPPARGRPRKRPVEAGSAAADRAAAAAAVRVGVRRKMAKKVFDPSDNNIPNKRKRGRPIGSLNKAPTLGSRKTSSTNGSKRDNNSTPRSESQISGDSVDIEERDDVSNLSEEAGGVCSVCLVQKARGSDRLVECRDCSNKAHTGCLQSGVGMLKLRPDNTWQCPHCKTCVVCCETNDAGVLTVCSVCLDAYHALCHTPRIPERLKAWDQWECNNCQTMAVPAPPEPFLRPHERDHAAGRGAPLDATIPDIGGWSSDDVCKYFEEHLPEAAHVFREQEMDGQALSMARRTDIVRGLGLQLGPALRLYRIVVKLQSRRDDFTMCWG